MTVLYGVDISAYQSGPPPGKDFYFIKATEGMSYVDQHFPAWLATVQSWGALAGLYHFAHPSNDPTAEADFFIGHVRPYLKPGVVVCLDHEQRSGSGAAHDAAWARTWCARVQAAVGMKPLVYTYTSFAEEGRCEGLGDYPLWLARYSSISDAGAGPWAKAVMQQYTDRPEDEDVFFGGRDAWMALAGATPQSAQEVDMPEYLSVSRDQPEAGSGERTVHWDVTHEDTRKIRGDGKAATPGILLGGAHGAQFVADVYIPGGGKARLVEVDPGKSWAVSKAYSWHACGESWTESGCVSPGQHLWVHVDSGDAVTGTAKVNYWMR